jgi:hypothetical protein
MAAYGIFIVEISMLLWFESIWLAAGWQVTGAEFLPAARGVS